MPYPVASTYEEYTGSSFTIDLSGFAYESGDFLLCFCVQDGAGTTIATATSGWVEYGTQGASGGCRGAWFGKVAASSSETAPTFTGANDGWIVTTTVYRGVNTTTPVNGVSRSDWNNVFTASYPTVTTTANNCLIVHAACSDGGTNPLYWADGKVLPEQLVASTDSVITSVLGHRQQFTAGDTDAITHMSRVATEGGNLWTLALNDDGSANNQFKVENDYTNIYIMSGWSTDNWKAPNYLTSITAINGINMGTTIATVALSSAVNGNITWGYSTQLTNIATETSVWSGAWDELSSAINVDGKTISFAFGITSKSTNRLNTEGCIIVLADSSENYVAYQIDSYASIRAVNYKVTTIDLATATPYGESASPVDLTDITHFGVFAHRPATTGVALSMVFGNFIALNKLTATGGCAANPITPLDFNLFVNQGRFYDIVNTQGSAQALLTFDAQLGDGASKTYIDYRTGSTEIKRLSNDYRVTDNIGDITLYMGANDTFNMSSSIMASSRLNDLTIHASSSASASYNFENYIVNGFEFFNNQSGIDLDSLTFIECRGVSTDGVVNACQFRRSLTSPALTTADPSNVTNNIFVSSGTGHAIEITATGTYDFTGNTFTSYGADGTTDAAIYNNSGGAVTLNLGTGDSTPTVRNGTGASTTINEPASGYTIALPNIIDGSRYQIYNVTADTELDNAVVSGGSGISHTYLEGVDFTAGDTGRYRVAYQSGTTAKQTLTGTFTFPAGTNTNTLPVSQTNQEEYNTFAVDGSSVSEFAWDSGNIQVDINDTDNTTTIQRLGAWYYYFVQTATGIDEAFDAITWLALNSIRINTSNVDMTLDNTKATPLLLTGGRLYRDDGATIIAATSNSIQVDYEPVYTVETGTSGLTPTEAAQLAEISSVKAKTDSLTFTVSGKVDANTQYIQGTAITGSGTDADPWGP